MSFKNAIQQEVKITAPIYSPLREVANIGNSPLCLAVSKKTTINDQSDQTEQGRYLFVGSKDRRIRKIDLANPDSAIVELSVDRSAWVTTLLPSSENPDRLFYAAGDQVFLWNTFTDSIVFSFRFEGQVKALQVSPNESQLWVSIASKDKTDETPKIHRLDITSASIQETVSPNSTALSLCVHPTKDIIFAGLKDSIHIFHSQTLVYLGSIEQKQKSLILALRISKDGNLYAANDKGAITCWNLSKSFSEEDDLAFDREKAEMVFSVHRHKNNGHRDAVNCLELSEEFLFSGSKDKTIRQWNAKDGSFIRSYEPSSSSNVGGLALLKTSLYSGHDGHTINEWDIQASGTRLVWNVPQSITQMVEDKEGNLFVGCETNGQIQQLSIQTGKVVQTVGHLGSDVRGLGIQRQGKKKYLWALNAMSSLTQWDLSESPAKCKEMKEPCSQFFIRNETLITIYENNLTVFGAPEKKTFKVEAEVNLADVDETGRYAFLLISHDRERTLEIFDLREGKFLSLKTSLKRTPLYMTSFGCKIFLAIGNDVHTYEFDPQSENFPDATVTKTGSRITCMGCSPLGILFVGGRKNITELDTEGKIVGRLAGHTDEILQVASTWDGTIFSSSKDNTIREWSGTLQSVPPLFKHVNDCTELQVHYPDGLNPLEIFDAYGRSLVTFCAIFGAHNSLEFLLEKADKSFDDCETALLEAIRHQRWGLLHYFKNLNREVQHLNKPPSQKVQDLVTARILNEDYDFVREVVRFADFDRCILDVIAPLEGNDWEEMIQFLSTTECKPMKFSHEPNTVSKKTLLHYAIQKGSTKLVEELVENKEIQLDTAPHPLLEAFADVPKDKQIALDRLQCVNMILDAGIQLDLLFGNDSDSPYLQCLKFRRELDDVDLLNDTDALIERMNNQPKVESWRRNFAIKEFVLQFWHYAIFLIFLTAGN